VAVAGDHADLPAIDIDHAAGTEEMVQSGARSKDGRLECQTTWRAFVALEL